MAARVSNAVQSSNQLDQPCCQTRRSAVYTTTMVPGITDAISD